MIGIDIIDRQAILPRPPHKIKAYRNRILTFEEQVLLKTYTIDDLDIWMAWAAKESVYKLEYRKYPHRYFNAKKLKICKIGKHISDKKIHILVKGLLDTYCVELQLSNQFFFAIAKKPGIGEIKTHRITFSSSQSLKSLKDKIGYNLLLNNIIDTYELDYKPQLIKSPYPEVLLKEREPIAVSISHHGSYWASSFAVKH